jgi:hypothetical protein
MVLIGISSYPPASTEEVMKRMMQLPRLPEFIKGRGNVSAQITPSSQSMSAMS